MARTQQSRAERARRRRRGALAFTLAAGGFAAIGSLGAAYDAGPGALGEILGVTRKNDAGGVIVELTPTKHEAGRLTVGMAVTTHTVNDLDRYDLTKITTLESRGLAVAPASAPQLRGHHISGELVFPLETMPDSIAVRIRGLADPGVRVFSWH